MLATVHCFKKWVVYLRHNKGNVKETAHMSNVYITNKPTLSSREIRWMESLVLFIGQWRYKPGKGTIADPLSRMPTFYSMVMGRDDKALTSTPIQPEQDTLVNRIRMSY